MVMVWKKIDRHFGLKKPKEQVIFNLDKKSMCHVYMISFFIASPTQGTIRESANSRKI